MITLTKFDRSVLLLNRILIGLLVLITLSPLLYVLIASFMDPMILRSQGLSLNPADWSMDGYKRVLQDPAIIRNHNRFVHPHGQILADLRCLFDKAGQLGTRVARRKADAPASPADRPSIGTGGRGGRELPGGGSAAVWDERRGEACTAAPAREVARRRRVGSGARLRGDVLQDVKTRVVHPPC